MMAYGDDDVSVLRWLKTTQVKEKDAVWYRNYTKSTESYNEISVYLSVIYLIEVQKVVPIFQLFSNIENALGVFVNFISLNIYTSMFCCIKLFFLLKVLAL